MTAKKTTKPADKAEDAGLPLADQPKAEAPAADQSAEQRSAAGTEAAAAKPAEAAQPTEGKGDPEKPSGADDAAPAPDVPAATGVTSVFLLKKGKLGAEGAVVRVSRRKLADLELTQGEDWETPTAAQLAVGT